MKNFVVSKLMNYTQKKTDYSEERYEEIKYIFTGMYLTLSKLFVITILAIVFHLFKEYLLFTVFYIPLRSYGFGWHANKTYQCWIFSPLVFIGIPYLSTIMSMSFNLKYILVIFAIIMFGLYSPADTKKRPLVNSKRRLKFKIISTSIVLVYGIVSLIYNNYITNLLLLTSLYQCLIISPLIYKLSNQPFDNYKSYCFE